MNKYIFKTTATMKEYNNKRWYIDPNIIRDIQAEAETTADAILKYRDIVKEKFYIDISNNAIRNKKDMYIDTENGESKQIGYVMTAKTYFEDSCKWSAQYIDLWITILTVVDTVF